MKKRIGIALLVVIFGLVSAFLVLRHVADQRKEQSRRTHCASCLRSLSMACIVYSMDFEGKYPTNWSSVAEHYAHAGKLFDCKSKPGIPHDSIEGVDEWSDFILVPGITTNDSPDTILAYEPLSNHRGTGANVVDREGNPRWVSPVEFKQLKDKHGNALTTN